MKQLRKSPRECFSSLCDANLLTVGTTIRAPSTSSGGAYYSGKNRTINENDTCNITFDDGDQRENTPLNGMTLDAKNPNRVTTIVFGQGKLVVEKSTDEDGDTVNFLTIQCPLNIARKWSVWVFILYSE
jgi:hypothetical protein